MKKELCNHFTELGEELVFVDKLYVELKCNECGEIIKYVRLEK